MYPQFRLLPMLFVLPCSLFAQASTASSEATPFRGGQWAAQFAAGFGFGSLGFLKFRSTTRALLIEVRVSGGHAEQAVTDSTGSRFAGLDSDVSTQLRLGWRRYGGGQPKVATHYTVGVLAGFDHHASASPGGSSQSNGWAGGAFGDIGATYLVTPRLGLGALASASLTYSTATSEQKPFDRKVSTWRIGGSAVSGSLVATLFF